MKSILLKILGGATLFQLEDLKTRWFSAEKFKTENGKKKLFYGSFISRNELCFDVGANLGNRITPLLDIGAKVIAIEPQKECYKFLKRKFGNKIQVINKALGEHEGEKDFHISKAHILSSFSEDWINSVKDDRFKQYKWDKVIKTEMTTLDKLVELYGKPAYIKIDVEGYELEVLKGLSHPVNMISFEYTVPEQTNKVIQCIEEIEKINKNIECNYSVGESMIFAFQYWLSVENMKKFVATEEFTNTRFGDVYVRNKHK